jgi:hypothetical protein
MTDLADILGEDLSDCLDDLGDDVAPAQVEADAQNRAILLARRKKALARHIRNNPHELGKFTIGGAFKSIGKSITAPVRVIGKVATGDFKGALKTAADPMGLRQLLGKKANKTISQVQGTVGKVLGSPQIALKAAAAAPFNFNIPRIKFQPQKPKAKPAVKMKCEPCNVDKALSADIAKKVVPEMQRINTLLGKMELSRKATSEHNKKKTQKAWRKEVVRLLKQIQEKRCA